MCNGTRYTRYAATHSSQPASHDCLLLRTDNTLQQPTLSEGAESEALVIWIIL
jgi:hypothetical protein